MSIVIGLSNARMPVGNSRCQQSVSELSGELRPVISLDHLETKRGYFLGSPDKRHAGNGAHSFHHLGVSPAAKQINGRVDAHPRAIGQEKVRRISLQQSPRRVANGRGVKSCGRFHPSYSKMFPSY